MCDDAESQTRFAEIRLRACIRIGEISRDLEKAGHGGAGGGTKIPSTGISKEQQLAQAGISTSTAHRYEELAGGKEEQAQSIALEAGEHYFAAQPRDSSPVVRLLKLGRSSVTASQKSRSGNSLPGSWIGHSRWHVRRCFVCDQSQRAKQGPTNDLREHHKTAQKDYRPGAAG